MFELNKKDLEKIFPQCKIQLNEDNITWTFPVNDRFTATAEIFVSVCDNNIHLVNAGIVNERDEYIGLIHCKKVDTGNIAKAMNFVNNQIVTGANLWILQWAMIYLYGIVWKFDRWFEREDEATAAQLCVEEIESALAEGKYAIEYFCDWFGLEYITVPSANKAAIAEYVEKVQNMKNTFNDLW